MVDILNEDMTTLPLFSPSQPPPSFEVVSAIVLAAIGVGSAHRVLEIASFGFASDFEFRISDFRFSGFGFRISSFPP